MKRVGECFGGPHDGQVWSISDEFAAWNPEVLTCVPTSLRGLKGEYRWDATRRIWKWVQDIKGG